MSLIIQEIFVGQNLLFLVWKGCHLKNESIGALALRFTNSSYRSFDSIFCILEARYAQVSLSGQKPSYLSPTLLTLPKAQGGLCLVEIEKFQ